MKVFVYGTLKTGHGNNTVLKNIDAKFLGRDIVSNFTMYDLGVFPGAEAGTGTLHGEVYEVDNLDELDMLEGYPVLYLREEVDTIYGKAWIYTINKSGKYSAMFKGLEIVENGIWK